MLLNNDNVICVEPSFHMGLIEADKDDNKFVDCAIVAGAFICRNLGSLIVICCME